MNEEPSPSHVARVRDAILATFDVSPQEAQEQAYGLAALAEGWGGAEAQQHDWAYTIKKRLGKVVKVSQTTLSYFETKNAAIKKVSWK